LNDLNLKNLSGVFAKIKIIFVIRPRAKFHLIPQLKILWREWLHSAILINLNTTEMETNEESHLPHCEQAGNMRGQIEYQIASGRRFNAK
jgi:hypothetical protein